MIKTTNFTLKEPSNHTHTHVRTHSPRVKRRFNSSRSRCSTSRAPSRDDTSDDHDCRRLPLASASSSQLLLACAWAVRTLCTEGPPKTLRPYQEVQVEIPTSDYFHPPQCPEYHQRYRCSSIQSNMSFHPQKRAQFEAIHRMSFCLVTYSGLFLFEPQKVTSFECHPQKITFVSRLPTEQNWKLESHP